MVDSISNCLLLKHLLRLLCVFLEEFLVPSLASFYVIDNLDGSMKPSSTIILNDVEFLLGLILY